MKREMKAVKIEWIDSCSSNTEWTAIEEELNGEIHPIRITTFGVIVQETDECITVAQNYGTDPNQVCNLMTIPKGCIKELISVEELGSIRIYQSKQDWSEEDEKIMQTMIKEGDLKPSEIAWLKSLRPQPHWKPSEEQMAVLEIACKYEGVFTQGQLSMLLDLKEQLKKL